MSMLHWLATQKYAVDHVVSGMAINAIAAGGTNFLYSRMGDPDRSGGVVLLPTISFQILAICITIALAFWVSRTRGGIHITAVGADPEKARLAGLQPLTVRLQALLATGALTGLAGVYLVADTGVFSDNMTAGRGYIALAALILGGWRVVPTALACLAFGILSSVNLVLQGTKMGDFQLPSEFWTSLPYLATIVALAGFLGKQRTPQGLGKT
jgi:simple sugar transport system permease protein